MLLVQFWLACLLSIAFGRVIDTEDAKYREKNVVKKLTEKVLPVQVLHRAQELEYIPYRKQPMLRKIDDGALLWVTPDKSLESWTELPALPIIHPDEQAVDLPTTLDEDDADSEEQVTEPTLEEGTESSTTESTIQSSEFAATSGDDLSDEVELKKDRELGAELEPELIPKESTEELNVTEVYEEPFVRVYVKPLCEGPGC